MNVKSGKNVGWGEGWGGTPIVLLDEGAVHVHEDVPHHLRRRRIGAPRGKVPPPKADSTDGRSVGGGENVAGGGLGAGRRAAGGWKGIAPSSCARCARSAEPVFLRAMYMCRHGARPHP